LFSYVICAFMVKVPWEDVGWAIVWPPFSSDSAYLMAVTAVLGTTISPYLFFWQAGQEVEDEKEQTGAKPLIRAPEQAPGEFARIRIDTYLGMAISNIIALFIVITTAATLHAHGITDIQTSAQAAEALRGLAGPFTFALFAAGIIGTGMLTLPVLAGSAAYALGETLLWHVGLARLLSHARAFYATIAIGMALGVALNFSPIDPIRALYWSAVLNGVVAVPVMVMMMLLTMRPAIMGRFTLPRLLQGGGLDGDRCHGGNRGCPGLVVVRMIVDIGRPVEDRMGWGLTSPPNQRTRIPDGKFPDRECKRRHLRHWNAAKILMHGVGCC
jgi:Mn2+/Fe2+ NRAMP family transporter